jgi:quinohemoprotein ethanol dehydrogenase
MRIVHHRRFLILGLFEYFDYSGLVFVGRNDGRLTALDCSTGKRLWEFQTGAGMNSPPIAFAYEGVQYVTTYSGGNQFAGSPRGDSLWLFSLNGTMGPAPAATAANPAAIAAR